MLSLAHFMKTFQESSH